MCTDKFDINWMISFNENAGKWFLGVFKLKK
jgi:hypothetical protein